MISCQTYKITEDKNHEYDFYFGKEYIQIIGKGETKNLNNKESYSKKLEECVKEAKIYADSKWLGITEKYIELQTLWYDRLKNHYYSHWKTCFENAKIIQRIPIYPNQCKIVVHYFCNPFKW